MRRASRNVGELIPAALTAKSVESVVIVLPTGYDHLTGVNFCSLSRVLTAIHSPGVLLDAKLIVEVSAPVRPFQPMFRYLDRDPNVFVSFPEVLLAQADAH